MGIVKKQYHHNREPDTGITNKVRTHETEIFSSYFVRSSGPYSISSIFNTKCSIIFTLKVQQKELYSSIQSKNSQYLTCPVIDYRAVYGDFPHFRILKRFTSQSMLQPPSKQRPPSGWLRCCIHTRHHLHPRSCIPWSSSTH